jgi:hypothetical protein
MTVVPDQPDAPVKQPANDGAGVSDPAPGPTTELRSPNVEPAMLKNPILLWLAIHGGDPALSKEIEQLTAAAAIHQLADSLNNETARAEIQKHAATAISETAKHLASS